MGPLLRRYLLGDRGTIAGTVYGTIVVLSVIAAGAKAYEHQLWRLASIAAISAVVLWVAHVYSHALGESLVLGRRITFSEILAIARREYAIVLAAVLPVVAIMLGAVGLLHGGSAVGWAFAVGIIALTVQGVRYARLEALGPVASIITVSVNVAIGLILVALEAFVAH